MRRSRSSRRSSLAACEREVRTAPAAAEAIVNRVHELRVGHDAIGPGKSAWVRAEIAAPSGARTSIAAFRRGDGVAIRFRPLEPGLHAWRVLAGDGTVAREVARGEVRAVDVGAPGGVRVRGGALVGGRRADVPPARREPVQRVRRDLVRRALDSTRTSAGWPRTG